MLQNPSQEGSPAYTASRYFANQYVKPSNLKTSKTNLHASLMSATSLSTAADFKRTTITTNRMSADPMSRSASSLFASPRKIGSYELASPRTHVGTILRANDKGFSPPEVSDVNKLLEEGFNVVNTRQGQVEGLQYDQAGLLGEVQGVNKEILFEQQRSAILRENLKESKGIHAKYREDIDILGGEIKAIKQIIENRKKEQRRKEQMMESVIGKIENDINETIVCIAYQQNVEKQEIEVLKKKVEQVDREEYTLNDELRALKRQVEEIKAHHSLKQKTMNEKSRNFLGTIQGK